MVEKIIYLNEGYNGKREYYYFEEYDTWEDALLTAKNIRKDREKEFKIRWFILEIKEGRFLPTKKFILYLNKKLRIW